MKGLRSLLGAWRALGKRLESSLKRLRALQRTLGEVLEVSWSVLERSRELLERSWKLIGTILSPMLASATFGIGLPMPNRP